MQYIMLVPDFCVEGGRSHAKDAGPGARAGQRVVECFHEDLVGVFFKGMVGFVKGEEGNVFHLCGKWV